MDQVTLGTAYSEHGHVYAVGERYLHIHIYTVDEPVANYVARLLQGRKRWHSGTWVVLVTKRELLADAARKLLQYDIPETQKTELRLVVRYCEATTKEERARVVAQFRRLVKTDVVLDAQDVVGEAAGESSTSDGDDSDGDPEA